MQYTLLIKRSICLCKNQAGYILAVNGFYYCELEGKLNAVWGIAHPDGLLPYIFSLAILGK